MITERVARIYDKITAESKACAQEETLLVQVFKNSAACTFFDCRRIRPDPGVSRFFKCRIGIRASASGETVQHLARAWNVSWDTT